MRREYSEHHVHIPAPVSVDRTGREPDTDLEAGDEIIGERYTDPIDVRPAGPELFQDDAEIEAEIEAGTEDGSDAADDTGSDDAGNDARNRRANRDIATSLRILNERLDVVRNDLRDMRLTDTYLELASIEEQRMMNRHFLTELRLLRSSVQEIVEKGRDQDPGAASAVATQATVMQSEFTTASKWGAAWQKVREAFERALPSLWNLISRLVRVKEWTVTGQLKSDPFGLAQASISITFGG